MPKFAYAAIDTAGAPVEGVTKADTIGAARGVFRPEGIAAGALLLLAALSGSCGGPS